MKLYTQYSRYNFLLMIIIFSVSAVAYLSFVQIYIVGEIDESLTKLQVKVKRHIEQFHARPDTSALDNFTITYTPVDHAWSGSYFKTIYKHDPSRKKKLHPFRQFTFPEEISGKWYQVTLEEHIEGTKLLKRNMVKLSLAIFVVIIVFSTIINRIILKKLWSPFYQTLAEMHKFQVNKRNNLNFPKTNIDEFTYMNDVLKSATQKADEDYISLKEFTENASHELQTPLTIIRSKLDILIQDKNLSKSQEKTILSAYGALKKMSQLNYSLLLLAKIDNQQFCDIKRMSFKERMEEKLIQFEEMWQGQIQIRASIQESFINMSYYLNDVLLNNLLSNATIHNVKKGSISIELEPEKLTICNTGVNHPLDYTRLFKRFYKESLGPDQNGLGLSIVKQICNASGIEINYEFNKSIHLFRLTWKE
jgi:signal transduction histidine kinase